MQIANGRYLDKIYQGGKSTTNSRSRSNLHSINNITSNDNNNRLLTVGNVLAETPYGSRLNSPSRVSRSPSNTNLQPNKSQSKRNLIVSSSKN